MAYVIDVSSMDFPDGAQRFNWCNCQKPAALAAGLEGIGQTDASFVNAPIVDWTITDYLPTAGGGPTAVSVPATITSVVGSAAMSWWPLVLLALAAWFFFFRRKGRR